MRVDAGRKAKVLGGLARRADRLEEIAAENPPKCAPRCGPCWLATDRIPRHTDECRTNYASHAAALAYIEAIRLLVVAAGDPNA